MRSTRLAHGWPGRCVRAIFVASLLCPIRSSAQTYHDLQVGRELGFVGAGLVLNGGALGLERANRGRPLPVPDIGRVPLLDRSAVRQWSMPAHRASNWLFVCATAASVTGGVFLQRGHRPLEPVAISAQSVLLTAGITNTVKQLVRRPRPYLFNSDVPSALHHPNRDHVSFWSGHSANIAAMTISTACMVQRSGASSGAKTATWAGACVTPVVMGYLRVKAGRHFPTDVLAGCAAGALVGFAVPYFHRADGSPP